MLKIKPLNKRHDRAKFDCGVQELNQYLRNIARQHLNKGISRTFVLVSEAMPTEILGFYTLALCEVFVEKLPHKFSKKYPRRVAAAKLAQLAVQKNRQGQGLGSHMMIIAMERTLLILENIGIMGFFVDAKDKETKKYYEQFGFIPLPDSPLELFLPLATLRRAFDLIEKN